MKNIAVALIKAQSEMSNAVKGAKNPFFRNTYADLNSIREACIPALNNNGIVVLQPIVHIDGKNFIKTILLHESGELIESFTEIVISKQNDAQSQGSGITYARRYGLQSLVCIGAEDDDGNSASSPQQNQPSQNKPQNQNEPTAWLNVMDKDKNFTREWQRIVAKKQAGEVIDVKEIRKFYKVSKEVEQKINELINS